MPLKRRPRRASLSRPLPPAFAGSLCKPRLECASCAQRGAVHERSDTALICLACGHVWAPRRRLEADVQAGILVTLSARPDTDVWRRNTGALLNEQGRPIMFGIEGGSDIDGVIDVTIDGIPVGVTLQVEVKRPAWRPATGRRYPAGKATDKQIAFGAMIQRRHGIFIIADSVESAVEQLDSALERFI